MDDISGDNAGAPETDADGFGTGRELALLGEVAYFLVDRFWNFIKPGITLQHQPHVSVTLQEAGDRTQRAGAHQVVVTHEEAELASGVLYQAAEIAIVAKIGFVLEVAQRTGISCGVVARDGGNLISLAGQVFANDDFEISAVLGVDGVEQRR